MWARLVKRLRCPLCRSQLGLKAVQETHATLSGQDVALARSRNLLDAEFSKYIDVGLLLCHHCKTWFPVIRGLPVLLPYTTPLHLKFAAEFNEAITEHSLNYGLPARQPVAGEQAVRESFSREWLDYEYDGVIWESSYRDLEKRFLTEIGLEPGEENRSLDFLEIGCGLGITTYFAASKYKADAVGVDLSLAALRAAEQYRTNPFLHFVQASVFYLPFAAESFDLLYSRGVLHHTYSTKNAFEAVVRCCRNEGTFYLWVYGKGSIEETLFRRLAFIGEALTRPLLSRSPDGRMSKMFLSSVGMGYLAYNAAHRLWNSEIQPLNFRRALHAARDRFTPRFAFRHSAEQVISWFRQAGFQDIEIVNWRFMPLAEQEDYRRNVGVRGTRRRLEEQ